MCLFVACVNGYISVLCAWCMCVFKRACECERAAHFACVYERIRAHKKRMWHACVCVRLKQARVVKQRLGQRFLFVSRDGGGVERPRNICIPADAA